jgi:sporulation protein YlmC with PRC-barrel domain
MIGDTEHFTIGCDVWCTDGVCGRLQRVVVEPIDSVLTHLVVGPERADGRLVPVELVDPTPTLTADTIRLRCTNAQFDLLARADVTQFRPGASGHWNYGQEHMLSWPYYGLRLPGGLGGGMGIGPGGLGGTGGAPSGPRVLTRDRVPVAEVQVRRGQHVHAVDGTIGRVQGLVIDRADHHVTHVLLGGGHLWGHKSVAIPIGSIADVDDEVQINLTKDQVRDLPPVDLDQPE